MVKCHAGGNEAKGAIATLLKLTQESGAQDKTAKKRKRFRPVNRPIIAICNDLYAPALRPLRGVSQVVTFKQAQVSSQPSHP